MTRDEAMGVLVEFFYCEMLQEGDCPLIDEIMEDHGIPGNANTLVHYLKQEFPHIQVNLGRIE